MCADLELRVARMSTSPRGFPASLSPAVYLGPPPVTMLQLTSGFAALCQLQVMVAPSSSRKSAVYD